MEFGFLFLVVAVGITLSEFRPNRKEDVEELIISMERAALDRWAKGDPSGFLEISAPDVVYFDPFLKQRVDGLEALTRLYEGYKGRVYLDSYELVNPAIQAGQDMAVLTFNFVSRTGDQVERWNCTEVYRRRDNFWKIIQTHWSLTAA